jgi:hypothetical protein
MQDESIQCVQYSRWEVTAVKYWASGYGLHYDIKILNEAVLHVA